MKTATMRVRCSLPIVVLFVAVPASVAAQSVPPPVSSVSRVAAAAHSPWFERYQEARSGPETSDRWSRTFKVGPNGSLELSNISGDIVITGGPGDEIRVEAVKRVHARDAADAKQQLDAVTIQVNDRAGRVEIDTNYARRHDTHVDVEFTVRVPANTTVGVHSVSGSIQLTGVNGEARLESVSGDVTTSQSEKLTRVKSVSGDVSVTEGGAADALSLGTISGNLNVKRLKARTLDVQTISGDLSLVDTACERVQAKSVSGDLHFGGPLAKAGRYEFNTHSGDVRLVLGGGVGFEITATTFSGDLRSDIALSGGSATSAGDDVDDQMHGPPHKRELRGTVGDGSAIVQVQTFSGDLVVTSPAAEKGAVQKGHGDKGRGGKDKHKDKDKDKGDDRQ